MGTNYNRICDTIAFYNAVLFFQVNNYKNVFVQLFDFESDYRTAMQSIVYPFLWNEEFRHYSPYYTWERTWSNVTPK